MTRIYAPVIQALVSIEKPILAAIHGAAASAEASLALACDLRIMTKDASIAQIFSNIGWHFRISWGYRLMRRES